MRGTHEWTIRAFMSSTRSRTSWMWTGREQNDRDHRKQKKKNRSNRKQIVPVLPQMDMFLLAFSRSCRSRKSKTSSSWCTWINEFFSAKFRLPKTRLKLLLRCQNIKSLTFHAFPVSLEQERICLQNSPAWCWKRITISFGLGDVRIFEKRGGRILVT